MLWEWSNQQSGVLAQTKFVDTLSFPVQQGTLMLQTGQGDSGTSHLLESLKDSASHMRRVAAEALKAVAQAAPALADSSRPAAGGPAGQRFWCAPGSSRGVEGSGTSGSGGRVRAFQLLIDYDANVRNALEGFLADLLVTLAADEAEGEAEIRRSFSLTTSKGSAP